MGLELGTIQEKINSKKHLRIVAHTSVEGYCGAAVLATLLTKLGKTYHLTFSEAMTIDTDLSVGHPDAIIPNVEEAYILVQKIESSSKIAALFPLLASLARRKDVNNDFVQDAMVSGAITTKVGFTIPGAFRPLLNMIQESMHPWFGGTKESAEAIFLRANINPYIGRELKTTMHLTDEEMERLREIVEHMTGPLLGQTYILSHEKENFRDARELAMGLLAAEAFKEHTIGFGLCVGSETCRNRIEPLLSKYRKQAKTLHEATRILDTEKTLHFLPIDTVEPKIVEHYIPTLSARCPAIISVRNDEKNLRWILRCKDHPKLMERITSQLQTPFAVTEAHAWCMMPADQEEKMLDFVYSLLNKKEHEEVIEN